MSLRDDEAAQARCRFGGEPASRNRGVYVWNPFHYHRDRPGEFHHLWFAVPESRRERPVNVTRVRAVLRGCDLRRFDSSRYVHVHIKLDVALSIFNGSALVDASCEVAPFNALPLDQEDADTEPAVAAIDEAVGAIDAHRSSLLVCALGCSRL